MSTIKHTKYFIAIIFISILSMNEANAQPIIPIRLAVAGTSHGHVPWILGRKQAADIEVVGIYEKDEKLSAKYGQEFSLNSSLFFTDLHKMLDAVKPEAVVAFGSTYEHLAVVEACAPRGIHVMVEKPLATTTEHALKMMNLAKKYNIHLLTNYETSWYPSTEKTYQLITDSNYIGNIKKAVFLHGHPGPEKIGVNKEFLQWLTDPVQNGGGALMDFGCYGANIMTYLMKGELPVSVTAVIQNFQPSVYPNVDDEATIIVNYLSAQCIIQASWNWPFNRKDMEIYGVEGYIKTLDDTNIKIRNNNKSEQHLIITQEQVPVYRDPFSYFADVIRGKIKILPFSLYTLENNIIVVRILEAAKISAKTGKTVFISK
ncbi:MAG: Gfo/Idh/MocA family oxidoreductase [Bacteroidota bacterium]|nr:Gfo/Idh/MocA family oxidoreductase [Bacteroidota bacterium]